MVVNPVDPAFLAWVERQALARWRVATGGSPQVKRLAGDASSRRFYRLCWPNGLSLVGMMVPPELAEQFSTQLNVYARLRKIGWPVPTIVAIEPNHRWILMEDGGEPVQGWITACLERDHHRLLETAYRNWLASLKTLQTLPADPHSVIHCRHLNARWVFEFNFFVDHFLGDWAQVRLTERDRSRLTSAFEIVAAFLARLPQGICHRDYHSRNILHRNGRFLIVDYQDMQRGPLTYDVVSLLRDCYVVLPDVLVAALREEVTPWVSDDQAWFWTALQRHLKALGTFGYQIVHRGRMFYRPAIANTLEYLLRDELATMPALDAILRPIFLDQMVAVR